MHRFIQTLFFLQAFLTLVVGLPVSSVAQQHSPGFVSQEVSDEDQIPVLVKHLPDWESVRAKATITNNIYDIRGVLGDRPIFSSMEFIPGTEAVTAPYAAGNLLLIEHPTPQAASAAEANFQQTISQTVVYRRIGNYSSFVFDAADTAAANALLDQIKYEKSVHWLGEDPFLMQRFERYMASMGRDVALSTVLFITSIFLTAIVLGVIGGFLYFRYRERQRAGRSAFSDAGGLTRLNLDDLSEPLRLE